MQLSVVVEAVNDKDDEHRMMATWFREARQVEPMIGAPTTDEERDTWRQLARDRLRTLSVALVLCLNIGVDPPDVIKPNPTSKLECWIDPLSMQPQKAMDRIGAALQTNYGRLQPRARYKTANDPTVDEVKKLCTGHRRNAKEERVLFHYNGHGVPKPTENGEIWVFNKNYTQYIPLSIYDLQTWMGHPSIYVWDCNSAGTIVKSFRRFAVDHDREWLAHLDAHRAQMRPPPLPSLYTDISLEQQADQCGFRRPPNFRNRFPLEIVDQLPGDFGERRTLLGDLNWVFTAITDTIAWNTFPRELFRNLFRRDLLIAGLFRNFLLADRIMRAYNCHPLSSPPLPSTAEHPLWESWDYTLDLCLTQLCSHNNGALVADLAPSLYGTALMPSLKHQQFEYRRSSFFVDQLDAFDIWLRYSVEAERQQPPHQLPVVLQVLLGQVHRMRALELLSRFLDLGSWAVGLALTVGIFPYMIRLLQSGAKDLRPLLAFIWAKILAVDPGYQEDLVVKDNCFLYFIQILNDPTLDARKKINTAYVLATLIENNYKPGQEALTNHNYVTICMELLSEPALSDCRLLRLWLLIGMGRLWADFDEARWQAVRLVAHERVAGYLQDPVPEVRTAAVFALGSLVSNRSENNEHATQVDQEICVKLALQCTRDGSPMVRCELVVALHWFLLDFENPFVTVAYYLGCDADEADAEADVDDADQQQQQQQQQHADTLPRTAKAPARRHASMLNPAVRQSLSNFNGSVIGDLSPRLLPRRQESLSDLISSPTIAVELTATAPSNDQFRRRLLHHIRLLETKTFNNPYETIWLSFLRLAVDPMPIVAQSATKVVEHVHALARTMAVKLAGLLNVRPKMRPSIGDVHQQQQHHFHLHQQPQQQQHYRPKFIIGSPSSRPLSNDETPPQRNQPPSVSSSSSSSSLTTVGPTLSAYTLKFPRKREPFGSGPQPSSFHVTQAMKIALVHTDFVPWCSKRFTEPLLDIFQGSAGDGISDRQAVTAAPTDWAEHMSAALIEHAQVELSLLNSHQRGHRLDVQKFIGRNRRPATSLAFSLLRPHLYTIDADTVSLYTTDCDTLKTDAIIANPDTEPFVHLDVINHMTTELVITGTSCGLVRVWDVGSDHVQLVTAAQLVHDQNRLAEFPSTVFHWEQERGLLLVSGDMRICRLWDAHAERKLRDLPLGYGPTTGATSISSDIAGGQLVCLGCTDGTVQLFDLRLPTNDCRVITLRDLHSLVVKVHLMPIEYDFKGRLIAGSVDGQLRVWEPRMFKEPVTSLNVPSQSFLAMDVQSSGQLICCATSTTPTVKLLDFNGRELSTIRYHDGIMGSRLADVVTVGFHPQRVSLAVASKDSFVAVYGMS